MSTRLPRVENTRDRSNSTLATYQDASPPASASFTPRPRSSTVGHRDIADLTVERRRSSLISRADSSAPVPAIPAHFLHNSPRAHPPTPTNNTQSHTYKDGRLIQGAPASSPLAHDFDFSFPLGASPSRLSLLSPSPRNAAGSPVAPTANFSRVRRPATNASFHRALHPTGEIPTTKIAGKRRPLRDQVTLEALTGVTGQDVDMDQTQPEANADLFLQLAEDGNSTDSEPTLTQRATSRTSWNDKRQPSFSSTLHAAGENGRPRTSGQQVGRPASRFATQIDTNRANNGYPRGSASTANFTSPRYDETTPSSAHLRRKTPFSNAPDCSPRSSSRYYERTQSPEKSPELPTFGRRRPSFGYPSTTSNTNRHGSQSVKQQGSDGDSPANSSEAKQSAAESDSVDSQTAPSTVWDELDDLKSRIKKLELTGKIPSTSNAAVTGGGASSERPRTATTAPTTINSSPKQDRKPDQDAVAGAQKPPTPTSVTLADIHPTLHVALAKAKALLSASLYRTLEATANDAVQLVAMTGSAGPQGTTFSAASIINGVTVSDRHIRRKADMMCRNLTDLCLALCEGKHEAPSIVSSPVAIETPPRVSVPKSKYSRSSLAFEDPSKVTSRPFSRLEARRSSILGVQPSSGALNSPQASGDDVSMSEYDTTPSHTNRALESRRQSRLSNRLSAPRFDRYEDHDGDEDMRPPSRAMTEFGNVRSPLQQQSPRDYNGSAGKQPHRSPSLRESLSARRANASAHVTNREVPRVASLNLDPNRRRFPRQSTPPVVLEEEAGEQVAEAYQRRRLTSFGHYVSSRRAIDLSATRSTSMSHRQPNVMVE
jgi:hypothetical protein